MVTIRLTRRGAKKQPFYHVVVTDSRIRQGGTTLEQVGYFNPIPAGKQKRLELNLDRIDYWVGKGARPSERVAELVKKHRKQAVAAGGPLWTGASSSARSAGRSESRAGSGFSRTPTRPATFSIMAAGSWDGPANGVRSKSKTAK